MIREKCQWAEGIQQWSGAGGREAEEGRDLSVTKCSLNWIPYWPARLHLTSVQGGGGLVCSPPESLLRVGGSFLLSGEGELGVSTAKAEKRSLLAMP